MADDQILTLSLYATTRGTAGAIIGQQYDAIELQYVATHTFAILSYTGNLAVQ